MLFHLILFSYFVARQPMAPEHVASREMFALLYDETQCQLGWP